MRGRHGRTPVAFRDRRQRPITLFAQALLVRGTAFECDDVERNLELRGKLQRDTLILPRGGAHAMMNVRRTDCQPAAVRGRMQRGHERNRIRSAAAGD